MKNVFIKTTIMTLFVVSVMLTGCKEKDSEAAASATVQAEPSPAAEKTEDEKNKSREEYVDGLDEHIAELQAQADADRKENENSQSTNADDGAHPNSLAGDGFLEKVSGKTEYDSFDEVIGYLSKDQGYVYSSAYGRDDQVLVVAEFPYDSDGKMVAADINVYGICEGKVKNIGNIYCESSYGEFRVAEGIFYLGSNHEIASFFFDAASGEAIHRSNMYTEKDSVGESYYIGFERIENTLEDKGQAYDTTDSALYDSLVEEYEAAQTVEFTIIK